MIQKTITYKNFNGVEVTKTMHFNLTAAEVTKLELESGTGIKHEIESIIAAKDQKEIVERFSRIIDMAYGVKSDDGETFEKSPEILAKFKATQAYSDLFMSLATNEQEAIAFVQGILPKSIISTDAIKAVK